ncbi:CHAT domain-containing protein [Phormidesmis sp. 146-12]
MPLGLILCFLVGGTIPGTAHMAIGIPVSVPAVSVQPLIQMGQTLYQTGRFLDAANVWETEANRLHRSGDTSNQALIFSYLALTYQQLGRQLQATQTLQQAIALPASPLTRAQILNTQGQLYLTQGQPQAALKTWQQAENQYRRVKDSTGTIGTQLNQAKALQALGFYRRARTQLEQIEAALQNESESSLKAVALLNLGNVLRVSGDLAASERVLQKSLAIAQRIRSRPDMQIAWLNLGNTAEAKNQQTAALMFYEQAAAADSPVRLQAQLNQLDLLIESETLSETLQEDRTTQIQRLLTQIRSQLDPLPSSQTAIYAQINLAQSLMKWVNLNETSAEVARASDLKSVAQLLAKAIQQAKSLGNLRAQSYATGRLGQLYEQIQQWSDAESLTREALLLSEIIHASDITYQWQWQLGRILKTKARLNQIGNEDDYTLAIASYTQAVNTLQLLRNDLVTVSEDAQFSFREKVEPVYRELVDLLLQQSNSASAEIEQDNLKQARSLIESLQLAELANFFREACVDSQPQQVDQIDPQAAVIYPIVLVDRLEVILAISGQPLRHYATQASQTQVEDTGRRMRQSLRSTSFAQERLPIAQDLYSWLVKPALTHLAHSQIKTLVFVLDGVLRDLPMAALYDGNQYLIEQYQVVVTPGLRLFGRQTTHPQIRALIGGLSQGNTTFAPLPGVKQEVIRIGRLLTSTVLLDETFTTQTLKSKLKTQPVSVVHLATHGEFSSKAEDTYIATWDGRLNVKALDTLLTNREYLNLPSIDLLVLSACETAKGDRRAALGLAGVAVRSGASSTLATLWQVNDQSTAEFMVQFYQAFAKSRVKGEAVRSAQLHLLKQPAFNHPYYWAPFVLIGNWL